MALQDTDAFALERIPDVACPVVVATKQDPPRDGEGDRRDGAQDIVVSESVEFSVSADVKEATRCIV